MASKENTNGDTGIKILRNEPFHEGTNHGQFTHKIYYLGSKLPSIVQAMLPASLTNMTEKAWNQYPDCRTEFHNEFLGDRFSIVVTSKHIADDGTSKNVFNLSQDELAQREVIHIDIGRDLSDPNKVPPVKEPSLYRSANTGRGPLTGDWISSQKMIMCCYKLCRVEFKVWGFQGRVEETIKRQQKEVFTEFQKKVFCSMDEWIHMNMSDIRELEERVKREIDEALQNLGMVTDSDSNVASSIKSTPF